MQNYLYTSFSEYMNELVEVEKKDANGKTLVPPPVLDMTNIMMDPNQSYQLPWFFVCSVNDAAKGWEVQTHVNNRK